MIKRIALLPLDSRPCNIKIPHYISKICGFELFVPPIEILGDIKNESDHDRLAEWLAEVVPRVDALIVSVDMLAFGGLVHSRKNKRSISDASLRIKLIARLKKMNPRIKVLAFSEIMRLSVTVEDEKSAELWMNIFEFSKTADRFHVLGDRRDAKKLDNLRKRVPREDLEAYLKTRDRNHEINKKAIELVVDGSIDYLVLGIEDSSEYGPHNKEKRILEDQINDYNVKEKVKMMNGADEMSAILIAKARIDQHDMTPKVYVKYFNDESKEIISLYEDKPIKSVIADHLEVIGGVESNSETDCDMKLFVNTPVDHQTDMFLYPARTDEDIDDDLIFEINKGKIFSKPSVIADIKYCNAADPLFVSQLVRKADYLKLASFSGFNTTANKVGIALAHALSYLVSANDNSIIKWHQELLLYSLFNDYLYQAVVRPEIIDYLRKAGRSVFDLASIYDEIEYLLKEKMAERRSELLDPYLSIKDLKIENITFPWKRLFEIDFDIQISV